MNAHIDNVNKRHTFTHTLARKTCTDRRGKHEQCINAHRQSDTPACVDMNIHTEDTTS